MARSFWSAHTLGFDWPDKNGSIEKGKFADFIILDHNIFETPIDSLTDTQVRTTVFGGRVAFEQE
jgi:predicted amidohydrolase YtcJ